MVEEMWIIFLKYSIWGKLVVGYGLLITPAIFVFIYNLIIMRKAKTTETWGHIPALWAACLTPISGQLLIPLVLLLFFLWGSLDCLKNYISNKLNRKG